MSDEAHGNKKQTVSITLDVKKYRIRIHKAVMHLLGDPKFIQFLINPQTMTFVIMSVDHEQAGDQTHRIDQVRSDSCIEVYSKSFIECLKEVDGQLKDGNVYHIDGVVRSEKPLAVFAMETIREVK